MSSLQTTTPLPSSYINSGWQQRLVTPIPYLLCIIAVTLPFSIAVSNILFAIALLLSVVSQQWLEGAVSLWKCARTLVTLWLIYMLLMVSGLLWSDDISRGLVIISKQWSWLLIPMVFMACRQAYWQDRFMFAISIGLGLHLLLSIAQSQGVPLPVPPPIGSAQDDPAGLIGHIGFGLLYGMWAAWLFHYGWLHQRYQRYIPWIVAAISLIMIFSGKGRSGYIIVPGLIMLMMWNIWLKNKRFKILLIAALFCITSVGLAVAINSSSQAKQRVATTIAGIQAFSQGDFQHAEIRWSLWYTGWQVWKNHPWIGVGTGGFPNAAHQIGVQHPNLLLGESSTYPTHPHQLFLMDLVRWGPAGLLVLLFFFWQWFHLGQQAKWNQNHSCLISISATALFIHGIASPSLEEYYSSIFAALYFTIGLAAQLTEESPDD